MGFFFGSAPTGLPEIGEIVLWQNRGDYVDEKLECVVMDVAQNARQVKLGVAPFTADGGSWHSSWHSFDPKYMFRTHRIHSTFAPKHELADAVLALINRVGEVEAAKLIRQACDTCERTRNVSNAGD